MAVRVAGTVLLLLTLACLLTDAAAAANRGELELSVVDHSTRQPLAVRMHIKDARGRAIRPPRAIYWHDHFVFDGTFRLNLRPGQYSFELERGPEYKIRRGQFTIERNGETAHQFTMERFADLPAEGWWPGDLHIHRDPQQIELLMRAEDLHVAPVITWWNDRSLWDGEWPDPLLVQFDQNRFYRLMAGEDEREGGALLYFNLERPLPIATAQREYPSSVTFLHMARQHPKVHVDIEKPFWWDVPLWLATGQIDSIGLANNHMQRGGMLADEAWGKPRDKLFYPDPHGNGRWSQDLYYRILESGIRVPPSAGSASGVLANPVGYNRVYVHCGPSLEWDAWWEGLRAGRVVVTNGPLLRPLVNGHLPGHTFTAAEGEQVELDVALTLSLRDPVDYLEIVQNGRVVHEVALRDYAANGGKLPTVTFQSSGWLLVRAVTRVAETFRFASSGPYYVQVGTEPRISRSAAQFFLDWVEQRMARIELADPRQKQEVLSFHEQARRFWQQRVEAATTD